MIIKNQVLSIVSSLSIKKIQSELWTNKQPSVKWHVSWAIQNGKWTRLSGNTITETKSFDRSEKFARWKNPLNSCALKTCQNFHLKWVLFCNIKNRYLIKLQKLTKMIITITKKVDADFVSIKIYTLYRAGITQNN